jgi:tRNA threonylcarbamoyladenosine biosynthesis protein TsaE
MEIIYDWRNRLSSGKVVAQILKKVILLWEMGAGKTTFIKQLCKTLGVTSDK